MFTFYFFMCSCPAFSIIIIRMSLNVSPKVNVRGVFVPCNLLMFSRFNPETVLFPIIRESQEHTKKKDRKAKNKESPQKPKLCMKQDRQC